MGESAMETDLCSVSECQLCNPDRGANRSLSLLFQSAEKECYFCQILKDCVEGIMDLDNLSGCTYSVFMDDSFWSDHSASMVMWVWPLGSPPTIICVCRVTENHPYVLPSWTHFPDCTASNESRTWAKRQLFDCVDRHSCATALRSSLPTRVLDVGIDIDPSPTHIKVVETNESDENGYFTLSHCWGDLNDMTAKLTARTLNEYRTSGVPFESLPQTFRDAVWFTRKMGTRYLWIDSLCIIQRDYENDSDSDRVIAEEDWKRESGRMCSVYQNSQLTLAPAWARGCHDGLFYNQRCVKLERQLPSGPLCSTYARKDIHHELWPNTPLFKRGWIFQERLLSPRTLYFGESDLLWRCKERLTCHCNTGDFTYFRIPDIPSQEHISQQNSSRVEEWHELVTQYGKTKLTYESDKLAAMGGLAQYFNPSNAREYLAGLWVDSFWEDFIWVVEDAHYLRRTEQVKPLPIKNTWSSDRWLFPTWCWASVTSEYSDGGTICWQSDISKNASERTVLARRYERRDTDAPYKLFLEGVLVPTRLSELPSPYSDRRRKTYLKDDGSTLYVDYDYSREGKGYVGPDAVTYCLRLFEGEREFKSVVLRCVDEPDQVYERIGFIHYDPDFDRRSMYRISGKLPRWWTDGDHLECRKFTII